jgi:RNA polymerase sigma-70 factor (ECF subfamily)
MSARDDLYRRYGPALVRKAGRLLQNRADAQDVVHALFVELLEQGNLVADLPYLYRAVTNRCLNLVRDRDNRARLLERQDQALRGPVRIRCDDRVVGLDLLGKLAAALDGPCAEVLVYRFFDDMSLDEIATLVGASRQTVVHRLQRIREHVSRLDPAREVQP